ncbi:MAG: MotA/TolQ/ExbB proton channel family protein, partial [Xanthomonadales bacterium]|nr:MotA/TolQ/ExbB proton channel family protein [Xanthomonadales bacterium]
PTSVAAAAWTQGLQFLGETFILSGIAFLLGSILASLREGGGDVQQAMRVCQQHNTAMSRILFTALANRGVSRSVLKEILEEEGRQEVAHMDRFIGVLGVIAATAPLLGLLGTVIGMIEVFQQISLVGVGKADALAGGISKALNTTAFGLSVAIPSLVAYRYYESRVDRFVLEIEQHALRFVELLKGERA